MSKQVILKCYLKIKYKNVDKKKSNNKKIDKYYKNTK